MVVMTLGYFGCAIIVTTSAAADHGDDLGHAGRRPHARIARRRSRQSHRSRRSRRSRSETGDTVWLPLPPPMVLMAWDTSPPSQSESLGREPDGVCSHLQMDGVCSHHQKQSCSRLAVMQSAGEAVVQSAGSRAVGWPTDGWCVLTPSEESRADRVAFGSHKTNELQGSIRLA